MRSLIIAVTLSLLTSCSGLSDTISQGRDLLTKLNQSFEKIQPKLDKAIEVVGDAMEKGEAILDAGDELKAELSVMKAAAFKKADKDGDGEHDWWEKLNYWYLLGLGGAETARRKFKTMQDSLDQERLKRKRDVEALRNGQTS